MLAEHLEAMASSPAPYKSDGKMLVPALGRWKTRSNVKLSYTVIVQGQPGSQESLRKEK